MTETDDVISPTCELSDVSECDDSDDNQPVQGGSGLGVTCHVPAPSMDMSVSDSDDDIPDMPARITCPGRSTKRGRARGRGGMRGIDVLALALLSDELLEGGVGVVVVAVVAEDWQQDQHWTVPTAEIVVGKTLFPPDRALQHFGKTFYQMMCAPSMWSNCFSISK